MTGVSFSLPPIIAFLEYGGVSHMTGGETQKPTENVLRKENML
jgi:hypothetical protein